MTHQAEAYFCSTESQMTTSKKGKIGKLSSGTKLKFALVRRPQPAKLPAHKAGTNQSSYGVSTSDVKKEEGLKPEEVKTVFLKKKTQDRPKLSASKSRKRRGNFPGNTYPSPREKKLREIRDEGTS